MSRAVRAALAAACVVPFALAAAVDGRAGPTASSSPRAEDVRRAERIIVKIRRLDDAISVRNDPRELRDLAGKLYPELFVSVAEMRDGDIKTDLDTAAFLYREASRTWFSKGAAAANCDRERPDIYRPLCLGLRGGSARQLLAAKAAMHARWAEALVNYHRGARDAETIRTLAVIRAARETDLSIAASAVEALKPLEALVSAYPTYADYQEGGRAVARVGFDRLGEELRAALARADALLAWLPRGRVYYQLSSARGCYGDGLFWGQRVHQSKKLVVSAGNFTRGPLEGLGLGEDSVGYTVVGNWRKAKEYTRLAEQALLREGEELKKETKWRN